MQFLFFRHQFFYCFCVHFVGYAAIYRANRGTLRFFVKTLAFCAFIGCNIVSIYAYRRLFLPAFTTIPFNKVNFPFTVVPASMAQFTALS